MKKISHRFSSGFGDWQVMLPVEFEKENGLSSLLDEALWNGRPWNGDRTIPFILVGDRTLDPSTEEIEELGYDGFDEKYPYGKPLHQPGTKGEEFRDILNWGSIFGTEHEVTDNPANGGSGIYRIISPKMKLVLEQFHLPPHRFYPAQVTHEITGEKRPYYLFHLTNENGGRFENAYWPKMSAKIIKEGSFNEKLMKREKDLFIKSFGEGSFENDKDYFSKVSFTMRKHAGVNTEKKLDLDNEEDYKIWEKIRDYRVKHSYFVFEKAYDLLPLGTEILISNELKIALNNNFPEMQWFFKREEDAVDVVTGYQPGEELPF